MAMGRRRKLIRQEQLWTPTDALPVSASHPFYQKLNQVLDERRFDEVVERMCERFYAETLGRPGLVPGIYFRLLMVGYFEGIDSERGIQTPTREQLAKLDRKRKKKGSNEEWQHPQDPDARITKMKDGRTHLAHKAEHAVDMETGAIVAVTLQAADEGDTTTVVETVAEAGERIAETAAETNSEEAGERVNPEGPREIVTDKGYHSKKVVSDLAEAGLRTYCSEPQRGRQR